MSTVPTGWNTTLGRSERWCTASVVYCMTTSLASGGTGPGSLGLHEQKLNELAAAAGSASVRKLPLENPFSCLYRGEVTMKSMAIVVRDHGFDRLPAPLALEWALVSQGCRSTCSSRFGPCMHS